jgi:hypothetical protein
MKEQQRRVEPTSVEILAREISSTSESESSISIMSPRPGPVRSVESEGASTFILGSISTLGLVADDLEVSSCDASFGQIIHQQKFGLDARDFHLHIRATSLHIPKFAHDVVVFLL